MSNRRRQDAPAVDSDTGAVGLEGFSLAPSASATAPAPYVQQQATAPAQPTQQAAPRSNAAATSQTAGVGPKYAGILNAAIQSAMGQAADVSFVTITQQTIETLTRASQLAQKNASTDMQKFAAQLLSIYGGIQSDIAGVVKSNNIQVNIAPQPAADLSKLATLSGKDFDLAYMMVQQQQFYGLSNSFKTEAESGQNAALKSYAAKQLPMINQQKDMIQQSYLASLQQNAAANAQAPVQIELKRSFLSRQPPGGGWHRRVARR